MDQNSASSTSGNSNNVPNLDPSSGMSVSGSDTTLGQSQTPLTAENGEGQSVATSAILSGQDSANSAVISGEPVVSQSSDNLSSDSVTEPSEGSPTLDSNTTAPADQEKVVEQKFIEKINSGGGINLVPTLSKDEQQALERKSKFSFAAAFFILSLVVISIIVVGFNIFTKFRLNLEQQRVKTLEAQVLERGDVLRSNNELLDRISLYKNVQQSTLSPKEIMVYWMELTADYGQIENIEISGGVKFNFRGSANSLNDVAILWHKLSIDERVTNINLENVGKSSDGKIIYSFEGQLNPEYFLSEKVSK